MLISRGGNLLRRIVCNSSKSAINISSNGGVRHSGSWMYRQGLPEHSKANIILAEAAGGFMWWWILWHLWHEHEHITGEFAYPNPRKWTDAELGIPPDDEE